MSNLSQGLGRIERLILILRYCENLKLQEIADLLGLPLLFVEQTYWQVIKDQMRCIV